MGKASGRRQRPQGRPRVPARSLTMRRVRGAGAAAPLKAGARGGPGARGEPPARSMRCAGRRSTAGGTAALPRQPRRQPGSPSPAPALPPRGAVVAAAEPWLIARGGAGLRAAPQPGLHPTVEAASRGGHGQRGEPGRRRRAGRLPRRGGGSRGWRRLRGPLAEPGPGRGGGGPEPAERGGEEADRRCHVKGAGAAQREPRRRGAASHAKACTENLPSPAPPFPLLRLLAVGRGASRNSIWAHCTRSRRSILLARGREGVAARARAPGRSLHPLALPTTAVSDNSGGPRFRGLRPPFLPCTDLEHGQFVCRGGERCADTSLWLWFSVCGCVLYGAGCPTALVAAREADGFCKRLERESCWIFQGFWA